MKKILACITAFIMLFVILPFTANASGVFDEYTIVCFGDSITYRNVYVSMLAETLGTKIINAGVSGDKVDQGKARFQTDVLDKNPDIVVICFGMNDQAAYYGFDDMAPCTSLTTYGDTLTYFAETLKAAGADVIFVTPNLVNTNPGYYTPGGWNMDYGYGHMDDFCDVMRRVALETGSGLVDVNLQSKSEDLDRFFAKGDGIHPAQYGYSVYADMIAGYMQSVYANKNAKKINVKCVDSKGGVVGEYSFSGENGEKIIAVAPDVKYYEVVGDKTKAVTFGTETEITFTYTESLNIAPKGTYEVHDFFRMGGAEVNWGYSETAPIIYGDETGAQLTDGRHADTVGYEDPAWVGMSSIHPNYSTSGQYILFELDKKYNVETVRITVNNVMNGGIGAPAAITAFTSNDGINYGEGKVGSYESTPVAGESAVYVIELNEECSFIKLMYKHGTGCNWMFTDEVEIYRKDEAVPESLNVAPKATYEIHDLYRMGGAEVNWGYSETAPIVYGDETGDQLTDGKHAGTVGYEDTAWVGMSSIHPNYPEYGQYLLFKLDKKYKIETVRITVNNAMKNGIGAPATITAFTSNDGINYGDGKVGSYESTPVAGESAVYVIELNEECSFIKLMYNPVSGCNWMFTDEVEIFRKEVKFMRGDINGDEKIDKIDYLLIKRTILKTRVATDDELLRSDVNGNGKLDAPDYILVKRHCIGTYTIE